MADCMHINVLKTDFMGELERQAQFVININQ